MIKYDIIHNHKIILSIATIIFLIVLYLGVMGVYHEGYKLGRQDAMIECIDAETNFSPYVTKCAYYYYLQQDPVINLSVHP